MIDKHGNPVEVGDMVRVLEIPHCVLATLDDEEYPYIEAMLNKEYEIDELPEPDKASVSIWWQYENGDHGYGGLYMLANEFELVRKKEA